MASVIIGPGSPGVGAAGATPRGSHVAATEGGARGASEGNMRLKGARKKWVEVVNLWITPGVSIEHDRTLSKEV